MCPADTGSPGFCSCFFQHGNKDIKGVDIKDAVLFDITSLLLPVNVDSPSHTGVHGRDAVSHRLIADHHRGFKIKTSCFHDLLIIVQSILPSGVQKGASGKIAVDIFTPAQIRQSPYGKFGKGHKPWVRSCRVECDSLLLQKTEESLCVFRNKDRIFQRILKRPKVRFFRNPQLREELGETMNLRIPACKLQVYRISIGSIMARSAVA